DGIVFQPLLMKRNAKVPLWASILVPLGAGLFFNVWGVLLAPPLLAVIYTFREKKRINRSPHG
ncbi:MAG: AI-2E family transporter, partial [Acidobacteria bacterium]|nr:AI-2E family transporter [Acidobacteriota bacterium]